MLDAPYRRSPSFEEQNVLRDAVCKCRQRQSLIRLDDEDVKDVAADDTTEEVEVINAMTDTNNVSVIMLSTLDYNIPVLDCKYK